MRKNKAFFFDRDGILNKAIIRNKKPFSPLYPSQLKKNFEILNFLKTLKKKKYILIMITNQPEIKRGKLSKKALNFINLEIKRFFNLDDFFVCMHDTLDGCNCRKPKPGMILKGVEKWNIDLSNSYLIGDRFKDIDAGEKVNCKTIFMDYDYHERKPAKSTYRFKNFRTMINEIIKKL